MAPMPRQILLVFSNPKPGREDEYDDWYTNHHLAEILAIEGFHRAQRFRLAGAARMTRDTADAPWSRLAIYEVEEDAIERADAALYALARTERAEALEAGRTPALVMSPSMESDLRTWWFESISDVQSAGG
jgi:hypothetical protein